MQDATSNDCSLMQNPVLVLSFRVQDAFREAATSEQSSAALQTAFEDAFDDARPFEFLRGFVSGSLRAAALMMGSTGADDAVSVLVAETSALATQLEGVEARTARADAVTERWQEQCAQTAASSTSSERLGRIGRFRALLGAAHASLLDAAKATSACSIADSGVATGDGMGSEGFSDAAELVCLAQRAQRLLELAAARIRGRAGGADSGGEGSDGRGLDGGGSGGEGLDGGGSGRTLPAVLQAAVDTLEGAVARAEAGAGGVD